MPRLLVYSGVFLVSLALLPLAWLYRAQASSSARPRIHVVPDMDNQAYYRAQTASGFFADGRAMRAPVEGTVSRDGLDEDDAYYRGKDGDRWVEGLPGGLDEQQMLRGRERYQIYCAPCHGGTGAGDGPVARRAAKLAEGTWTPPADLTAAAAVGRPDGELFDIVTHGVRNMPAYGPQIEPEDRWAIILYVRALQRTRNATTKDLTPSEIASLK